MTQINNRNIAGPFVCNDILLAVVTADVTLDSGETVHANVLNFIQADGDHVAITPGELTDVLAQAGYTLTKNAES